MAGAAYIARAPEITIVDGVAKVKAVSEGETLCWHLPLLEFRKAVAHAVRALAMHDAAGSVVPIK